MLSKTFFKLPTGHIVTETEMKLAFEIVHGRTYEGNEQEYADWVNSSGVSIDSILYSDEVSIEELARGNCIGPAVRKYIQTYGGGLKDAKNAIDKMRDDVKGSSNA